MKNKNRYAAIIEHIFSSKFQSGTREVDFLREELVTVARKLRIKLPKNLGDLVYSFRYRTDLPESIRKHAGKSEPAVTEDVVRFDHIDLETADERR